MSQKVDPADPYWRQMLTTKFSHWHYENERRRFVSLDRRKRDGGLYFEAFSQDLALREIIVGAEAEISKDVLDDALGEAAPGVMIRKARLAFRTFRVVNQRNRKLWWR